MLLVAVLVLLVEGEVFEPLAVLVGLLVWAKQRLAKLREKLMIVNFVFMIYAA